MVSRPNLFVSTRTSLRPGSTQSSLRTEIDLRDEFDKFVFGDDQNMRHGYLVLLRRMRRDSVGNPTYCTCAEDAPAREGNPDCSYCLGEGYLWDEEWAMCTSAYVGPDGGLTRRNITMMPGEIRVDYKLFYFRYDSNIKYQDKIVEVKLDVDGTPALPYVRESIYTPETVAKMRSDYGRIEYFAIYCREKDALRMDNPE
jgi:hypothetical protein